MDADFVTYFFDIYREQFAPNYFRNKSIWIIGASSGIGECLTYDLTKNGASNIIISSRREHELKRVQSNATNMISNGQQINIIPLDLFDFLNEDYAESFIKKLFKQHPNISIIILNAAITQNASTSEASLNSTTLLFDINFISAVSIIKSVINNGFNLTNKNQEFQIVVTSSMAALTGEPFASSYAASKTAFNGYLQSLQIELIKYNIDFTLVYPSAIELSPKSLDSITSDGTTKDRALMEAVQNNMMTCSRCANLYSTAIYSKVRHSWISRQPELSLAYLVQYFSFILRFLQRTIGPNYL